MFDAVGNPQSILLLGGTSEIGLAVVSEYLRRQPLRVVLACMPGDPAIEASVDSLKAQGATSVEVVDFDAADFASHPAAVDAAFAGGVSLSKCISPLPFALKRSPLFAKTSEKPVTRSLSAYMATEKGCAPNIW